MKILKKLNTQEIRENNMNKYKYTYYTFIGIMLLIILNKS